MRKSGVCLIVCGMLGLSLLTGCGGSTGDLAEISNLSYEREEYKETEVCKGELSATFTMKLKAEGFGICSYSEDDWGLEIDRLYVEVGDRVQEGDLLLTFKSESISQNLEARQEDLAQKELLAEHYRKLMQADSDLDYESDVEALEMDIEVDQLYIEEYQKRLEDYEIRAQGNGTIIAVSDSARGGIYVRNELMIKQALGTGNYTGSTKELYDFQVGQEFSAYCGVAEYTVRVTGVEAGTDDKGNVTSVVTFEPVSDMSAVAENEQLKVEITQDALNNVVYVDTDAIRTIDDKNYVLVLDENGYAEIAWVTLGVEIGDYTVITEGLEGGEKVAL